MTQLQSYNKRIFDLVLSFVALALSLWLILLAWVISSIETGSNGFFLQHRVGKDGRLFKVIKIRTMKVATSSATTVTVLGDNRITHTGALFRRLKIDELPQLINVLFGQMSFVGPRPDVPGFADMLSNDDNLILTVRPGITGPATIKYKNEESILAEQDNPIEYNRKVIWPDKVKINKEYVLNWSLSRDICYIIETLFKGGKC